MYIFGSGFGVTAAYFGVTAAGVAGFCATGTDGTPDESFSSRILTFSASSARVGIFGVPTS